ncbi:transposase [Streptomyces microflavus]
MLLSRIQAAEDAAGRIDWGVSVASTALRAHQHAACARKAPPQREDRAWLFHLAADGRCRPLVFVLTPGHYGDGPPLERVLEQVSVPRTGVGRPRSRPDHVLADKACTSRRNRRYLRRRGIRHTIPKRLDQQRAVPSTPARHPHIGRRTVPPTTTRTHTRKGSMMSSAMRGCPPAPSCRCPHRPGPPR